MINTINKKTQRKNHTNLVLKFPSKDEYFTIKSLWAMNPEFVEITLRVRLKKAIDEEKSVVEIGCKNTGNGRPIKAFAMTPVNPKILEKAKADGIMLQSLTLPVIHITSKSSITTPKIGTPISLTNVNNKTPIAVASK